MNKEVLGILIPMISTLAAIALMFGAIFMDDKQKAREHEVTMTQMEKENLEAQLVNEYLKKNNLKIIEEGVE